MQAGSACQALTPPKTFNRIPALNLFLRRSLGKPKSALPECKRLSLTQNRPLFDLLAAHQEPYPLRRFAMLR